MPDGTVEYAERGQGPTILLVISYAMGQGMRVAMPVAVGVALGDFTAMTLSMLGVGARNAVADPRTMRIFNRAGGTAAGRRRHRHGGDPLRTLVWCDGRWT